MRAPVFTLALLSCALIFFDITCSVFVSAKSFDFIPGTSCTCTCIYFYFSIHSFIHPSVKTEPGFFRAVLSQRLLTPPLPTYLPVPYPPQETRKRKNIAANANANHTSLPSRRLKLTLYRYLGRRLRHHRLRPRMCPERRKRQEQSRPDAAQVGRYLSDLMLIV